MTESLTASCMTPLSSIQAEVERRLQSEHKTIVLAVFQRMCNRHNKLGECGCEYCRLLPEYVRAKRYLRHLLRQDDYWVPPGDEINIWANVCCAKRNIRYLKAQKDALKKLN